MSVLATMTHVERCVCSNHACNRRQPGILNDCAGVKLIEMRLLGNHLRSEWAWLGYNAAKSA